MKQWYAHNGNYYVIHHKMSISNFTKNGILNMEMVKEGRDSLPNVDHVLKTDSHFLFVETIQDAKLVGETTVI